MSAIGADYFLLWYTPAWDALGVVNKFRVLRYVRVVNTPGELRCTVAIRDLPFDRVNIVRDGRIDILRAVPGRDAVLETDTIWMITSISYRQVTDELEVVAESANTLLGRRVVAASPGTSLAEKTGAADTVSVAYIKEAMGTLAATDRQFTRLVVEDAAGTGAGVVIKASGASLLSTLQDIANSAAQVGSNIYTDIVYDYTVVPSVMRVKTFVGLRGSDRSSTSDSPLVFSEERDNLIEAVVADDWHDEKTVVYCFGAGQDQTSQTILELASSRATATPYARCETVVHTGQTKDIDAMIDAGQGQLWRSRPRRVVTGTTVSVESCQYGVHWYFGDSVVVEVDGVFYDARIDTVEVVLENGEERIRAGFRVEVAL